MLHKAKRWIVQKVINRHPQLKEKVFPIYSKYVAWTTRREVQRRLKSLKPENYYDFENAEPKNVIIITADCMRFKNTSMAGYERDTTPFLKSFGKSYKAVAGAPWTYPSVPTILTGLYPHNHGAYIHSRIKQLDYLKNVKGIKRNIITLPELFLYLGYEVYMATAIELSSLHFRRRIPNIKWYPGETRAEKLLRDFLYWVEQRKHKHFFAYIHLGDPHEPLNPPREYRSFFGDVKRIPKIESWDYTKPRDWKKLGFREFKENRILLYDNTIRYVNDQIESLFNELEKLKILDDTLIVITADHGEEFWEHAEIEAKYFYDTRDEYGYGHGHNVFGEIVEIPLLFYGFSKLKERSLTSATDIAPTVLKELGIQPKFGINGIPLQEKEPKGRTILTEAAGYGYEKKALYIGQFKFLYAPWDGVKWVFNLKKDPEEQHPIKDPQIIQIFEQKLKMNLLGGQTYGHWRNKKRYKV